MRGAPPAKRSLVTEDDTAAAVPGANRPAPGQVSLRAGVVDDLVALLLERLDPLGHGVRLGPVLPRLGLPALHARDLEQVVDLLVAELHEEVGQELPAGLADPRVAEGARERLLEVGHAPLGVLPDARARPVLVVQAALGVAV